jgi:hypothetical protein
VQQLLLWAGSHHLDQVETLSAINVRGEQMHTWGCCKPYRHIIAALSIIAMGLATSWPAMSGADPCTCTHLSYAHHRNAKAAAAPKMTCNCLQHANMLEDMGHAGRSPAQKHLAQCC